MATVDNMVSALSQGGMDFSALQELALNQQVMFTQYIKKVLPLDGYVFWLRTGKISVSGSLHVDTTKRQSEDETIAVNGILFTAGEEIQAFNAIDQNTMWVGEYGPIKFAFTRRVAFFDAAKLYHYAGEAVYPALQNMLIDVGAELPDTELIVSNSLPAWLALVGYNPQWLVTPNPGIMLYPSFAVPDNILPPYGAVHVIPEQTIGISAAPFLSATLTRSQLASDTVRVTLYGATNSMAMDFVDLVGQFSLDTDSIGIMNIPIVRDEKRQQAELGLLAMKKTIEFQVSYVQNRINTLARQVILGAAMIVIPNDTPVAAP